MKNLNAASLGVALTLSLGAGLLSATTLTPAPSQDVVDTRDVLDKWIETERAISAERRDWALGKELLTDRVELVQDEIDALRASIDEATASIVAADEKRDELLAENEALKAASASLEAIVVELEARVRELLTKLPPPIVERVSVLSVRLPKAGEATQASLSVRFQNIVGILNEVNKFHGDVALYSEVRELEDGTSAEVATLYIGIGQAYYVTGDGLHAGLGRGGPQGWTWTPANDAAPEIARAIRIFESEEPADFVPLTFQID